VIEVFTVEAVTGSGLEDDSGTLRPLPPTSILTF
jgi:hypothetical protein